MTGFCVIGATLRLSYLLAAPDVRAQKRAAYQEHLCHCPTCRAGIAALRGQAETAQVPELSEEQIRRA